MATSSVTAQKIIVNAIRMLNIFSEQFEDIPGHVETQALELFNENLDTHGDHGLDIPFYTATDVSLVAGQDEYTVLSNNNPIVQLLFANIKFIDNEQRYPVDIIEPGRLYKRNFNLDSKGRPQEVILKKAFGTSSLIFYPVPDQAYTCEIKAKIALDHVEPQDLLNEVPIFWHKFLRYELARELKNFYPKATWTAAMELEYKNLLMDIESATLVDFSPDLDGALLDKGNYSIKNGASP